MISYMDCTEYYYIGIVKQYYNFFFFKQKTAYEMRISDWSSDVCSSDLANSGRRIWSKIQTKHRISNALSRTVGKSRRHARARAAFRRELLAVAQHRPGIAPPIGLHDRRQAFIGRKIVLRHPDPDRMRRYRLHPTLEFSLAHRSEEHKSELQSLMRNSYA